MATDGIAIESIRNRLAEKKLRDLPLGLARSRKDRVHGKVEWYANKRFSPVGK